MNFLDVFGCEIKTGVLLMMLNEAQLLMFSHSEAGQLLTSCLIFWQNLRLSCLYKKKNVYIKKFVLTLK